MNKLYIVSITRLSKEVNLWTRQIQ